MDKPWKIIQELQSDNSRLFKEAIIRRESDAANEELFQGIILALDGFRTFGIQQVPFAENDGNGLNPAIFYETLKRMESRVLTGNEMRDAVDDLCNQATMEQWNSWYRRILIKDLRCGVTQRTINKHSRYKVPVFECMLADDSKKHGKKMIGDVIVEPKLDGVRVIAICDLDKREVKLFSRNGKELINFPEINMQLSGVLSQMSHSIVFDGEVVSGNFQKLMREIHRKGSAETNDAVLNLFDCIPFKDFKEGICRSNILERKSTLERYQFGSKIRLVEYVKIDLSSKEGHKRFLEYNKLSIDKGFEGIMVKPQVGVYECKRSSLWLKVKPFIEVSLVVKDFEDGTGRNSGKLGALICEGEDDGRLIRTNVGTGFSDLDRVTFWKYRNNILGQIVEIRADAITQNKNSVEEWSLRFPRFLRFRGFNTGEKL